MNLIRLLVSLGLLALVIWFVAPEEIWHALRELQPIWLCIASLFLAAQIGLSALRWQVTAQALGHPLPQSWALREYGLSVAVNTFLPGGVMGDLARITRARHLGWQVATASVVIERLAGQVALGVLAVGAVAFWLGGGQGIGLVIGGMIALLVMLRFLPAPRAYLARAWLAPRLWRWQAVLTLLILSVNLAGYWAAARAIGLVLPPQAALTLIPLTLLAMLIPVTINGWGLREGVAAALWPLWGVATGQAVGASLAFGLACMIAGLAGLLIWLLPRGETLSVVNEEHNDRSSDLGPDISQ